MYMLLVALASLAVEIHVGRDNVTVASSGTVRVSAAVIEDLDENGVLQIAANDVTLDFAGQMLRGAAEGAPPDSFRGYGLRITGRNVTIRNARIRGFKAAIYASGADGLVIEDCDLSGNFAQRLRSTPQAEVLSDWLWPHENESNEWLHKYGASIYVEESSRVTVRRCRAWHGQNGLVTRRVDDSRIYDNDFSFLSGWGIAMFRSSRNVISRNNCDFCMRGYSHGVYSRGQDSSGLLLFEQCNDNVIAFNSATHGGDGFFGFGGKAALEGADVAAGVGTNRNLLYGNDFSYSAANAIEMTFSFDNVFARNILNGGNYGVWGGYSSNSRIIDNEIADNLIAGVAIEHGSGWVVTGNRFRDNPRGVQLWWDDDKDLLAKPWAKLNNTASRGYEIYKNEFVGDKVGIELRGTQDVTLLDNRYERVAREIDADATSRHANADCPVLRGVDEERLANLPGERQAVGLRKHLAGRENIIMTEWWPYDWESPLLHYLGARDGVDSYRVLNVKGPLKASAGEGVHVEVVAGDPPTVQVRAAQANSIRPYALRVESGETRLRASRLLWSAQWRVRVFASACDPREDVDAWRKAGMESGVEFTTGRLELPFGNRGPSELKDASEALRNAKLPHNQFGTLATCTLDLPAGMWELVVTSDDGVRVRVDDRVVLEDWTHHGPKTDVAPFRVEKSGPVTLHVEHFELDGYATLSLDLRQATE